MLWRKTCETDHYSCGITAPLPLLGAQPIDNKPTSRGNCRGHSVGLHRTPCIPAILLRNVSVGRIIFQANDLRWEGKNCCIRRYWNSIYKLIDATPTGCRFYSVLGARFIRTVQLIVVRLNSSTSMMSGSHPTARTSRVSVPS